MICDICNKEYNSTMDVLNVFELSHERLKEHRVEYIFQNSRKSLNVCLNCHCKINSFIQTLYKK